MLKSPLPRGLNCINGRRISSSTNLCGTDTTSQTNPYKCRVFMLKMVIQEAGGDLKLGISKVDKTNYPMETVGAIGGKYRPPSDMTLDNSASYPIMLETKKVVVTVGP